MHHRKFASFWTIGTLLLAALPAIWLCTLVVRYGVEVPYLDDWEIAPLLVKARTGELAWADFVKQEEEARIVVPKLIFLATTGKVWDVRRQMRLSPFICAASAAGIYLLLRKSRLRPATMAVCFPLIALLIFSPTQFEVWLFASGFPSFLSALWIVGALVLMETRLPLSQKFGGAALLSVFSTFTLANGLLAWGVTFPVYLTGRQPPRWKQSLAAWLALTAVAFAIYLHGYHKPAHLPAFAPAVSAWDYLCFFLAFLGNGFAYADMAHRVQLAAAVGALFLTLFLGALAFVLRRRDAELQRRVLWCVALAFYSIGSAALATLGRAGYGVDWAVSSRYIPFSLYLAVAVVALLGIIGDNMRERRNAFLTACGTLGVALLLLLAACFPFSLHTMSSMWARNRLARSALLFSPVLDVSSIVRKYNYPHPPTALARAAQLDEAHLLRPPLIRDDALASLAHSDRSSRAGRGWCDELVALDATTVRASGWAALPRKHRPADAVVLAYDAGQEDWRIFAITDEVLPRPDVVAALQEREQLWSGWRAHFPRNALPPHARISAWAFDAESRKLYRLKQKAPELSF